MSEKIPKEIVVVSRKWDETDIKIWVNNAEIGLSMKLDDFLKALVEEVGNPSMLFTKGQLLAKLNAGSTNVIEGIKSESERIHY